MTTKAELMERLKKTSTIKQSSTLDDSEFFEESELTHTNYPMLNILQSGRLDGGFGSGLTVFAGESRVFKSNLVLLNAKAYLDRYDDAVVLFYDTEFGTPQSYFDNIGVDTERVFHTPVTDIEQLKFDIMQQLEQINKGDHVFIIIDSIGNIASKKEVEEALNSKGVVDMTRAKQLKSLFRMVTPHLTMKDIAMHAVNHIYMTTDFMPKAVVSGGCLLAGTKLLVVEDEKVKEVAIEDIKVGDFLISKDGHASKVQRTWDPETLEDGNPECIELEFDDGSKVTCSLDHKFMVGGKWVKAKDLTANDLVDTMCSQDFQQTNM